MQPTLRAVGIFTALTLAAPASFAAGSELAQFLVPFSAVSAESVEEPPSGVPNNPLLSDRFYIGLGAFAANSTTEAQLNSSSGVGASVDFEDALGLENTKVTPQLLARWRFTERWRLEVEHFQLDRSATRTLAADVTWGDEVFAAGSDVDSKFNVSVTRVSVGYSFFDRPDKQIGVALGFHLTDLDAAISTSGGTDEGGAALAPLPVLSLYGQFALTDDWAVNMRADAFKLEYDPYDGKIISTGLDVTYQPWRHIGFGVGYRSLLLHVGIDEGDWDGRIDSTFQGAIAFIYTSF